jgi:hypothetical protein
MSDLFDPNAMCMAHYEVSSKSIGTGDNRLTFGVVTGHCERRVAHLGEHGPADPEVEPQTFDTPPRT